MNINLEEVTIVKHGYRKKRVKQIMMTAYIASGEWAETREMLATHTNSVSNNHETYELRSTHGTIVITFRDGCVYVGVGITNY
jgi:hypothetical protein